MDRASCPFEKAITSAQCHCEMAQRYAVAERIGVACRSNLAAANCHTLLALVRAQARFALKLTDTSGSLPFGKELKVLIGTALGLQRLIDPPGTDPAVVGDIHELVQRAQQRFGGLAEIPFAEIVKAVAAFKPRQRGS